MTPNPDAILRHAVVLHVYKNQVIFTANAAIESTAVLKTEMQHILYNCMYLIYDYGIDLKVKQYDLF